MTPIETSLNHHVILPENSPTVTHPTLIMLHGRGADEEDLLGLSERLDRRLLIISARAPFPFPYGGYTWYDVGAVGQPEPVMFKTSYDALTTFVGDVLVNYPVNKQRVFLLGFSMGTVMSFALSLTQPAIFRGVIANSGYVPENTHLTLKWNELSGTEYFIAHGIHDPVIPVSFGRRTKQLFENAHASFTYREYAMAHQISEESLADFSAWLTQRLDYRS
jgi:phospholipase/carboxylesterase